ncbi:hypothetical protein [Gaetbulibacter aestuarii]|uniref:SpoIIAA-like protein n=1 Tax=Gaetbulibacter aestuarii TaxID=1502358 RepID=A0ABW7N0V1_9FLAO
MKFEDSEYFEHLKPHVIKMSFGTFYLCDLFFVSELNEGIHFDWDKIQAVISELFKYYGEDSRIGYIPNRVNSYSVNPHYWARVDKQYNIIAASAIVYYSYSNAINAEIEERFYKKPMKLCNNLNEAISWMLDLEVLKRN